MDELGDVMWYFTQLVTLLDLTHDRLMMMKRDKLKEREANKERQHVV